MSEKPVRHMNPLTLRFSPEIEGAFRAEYFERSLRQARFVILFGAFLYAAFGILDAWMIPEVKAQAWIIRYAIICPALIGLFLFTYSPRFKTVMQPSLAFLAFAAGLGIAIMTAIAAPPQNFLSHTGLILVILYAYTFCRLRFTYATVTGWSVVAVYELTALLISHPPFEIFLNNNFFLITANLIGMFAGYQMELSLRTDFLRRRELQEFKDREHHREKDLMRRVIDQTVASLRESEALFRTLAETTEAAIFIHQGERFVYANSAGVRQSGYSKEEILTKNFWDLVHPDFRELVRSRGLSRLRGEEPAGHYEIKFVTKSGEERWAYLAAGSIAYQAKPAVIGTLVDITDLKRAEEENVRQYQARIEEESRHQAEKDRILKDLHDGIGGLTTNINLLAELAQKNESLDEIRKSLATIAELSRESLSEIRGFIQSLDTREANWHTMAAELRHLGRTIVEAHGISFTMDAAIENDDGFLAGNLCLNLFRIYKEALSNVVKHSAAKAVTVQFTVHQGALALTISDDGRGVNGARHTGRGLLNMRSRAEEIGGVLSITSANGTVIHLDVPLNGPLAGSVNAVPSSSEPVLTP